MFDDQTPFLAHPISYLGSTHVKGVLRGGLRWPQVCVSEATANVKVPVDLGGVFFNL